MEFGRSAIPCGRTIQEPTIAAGAFVLVVFQATTAIERYLYASPEAKVLSGKITAAFVPVEMAVLRAISRAPMTWLRACFRPPLPVRPLRAGTATAARSPMMPTTARSSTRVKAAMVRGGMKELREEGVKEERRRFWVLDFSPRSQDALTHGCWVRRRCECCFKENVSGLAGVGMGKITTNVCTPLIYNVNTSLECKYWKRNV